MKAEQEKIIWIELLRIVSCFAVILLHVSTKGWGSVSVASGTWSVYEVFHSISRFGVCCFVMISGALFLGNRRGQNIRKLYGKYIARILILIVVWSFLYFIFRLFNGNLTVTGAESIFSALLFGNYHLWYLWMVIGLYIVTPLLNVIVRDKKLCEYFLILCVVVGWIPGVCKVIPAFDELVQSILTQKMYLFLPMGYVGYYILGYYLNVYNLSKKWEHFIYFMGILGVLYGTIGGIFYGRYVGEPSQATYNNLTINIAFYSVAIFLIFKNKVGKYKFTPRIQKVICFIGNSTLGIYLTHVIFVQGFTDRFMDMVNYNFPVMVLPLSVAVAVCAFILTSFIKKIPLIGKWIV